MDKKFYTVKEVAELLGCSANQVRKLCRTCKIQAIDIGENGRSYWRIPKESVEEFLGSKLVKKTPTLFDRAGANNDIFASWNNFLRKNNQ